MFLQSLCECTICCGDIIIFLGALFSDVVRSIVLRSHVESSSSELEPAHDYGT